MKLSQCAALFSLRTLTCRQHCYCVRELGHAGFCLAYHYGWPFHWLRSPSHHSTPHHSTPSASSHEIPHPDQPPLLPL